MFAQPDELIRTPSGVFLTADSAELAPYVDTIAQIDHCEASRGPIHGHEAGNPIRSPGRDDERRGSMMPMFENDPASGSGGNVRWYASTPTPAAIHNHVQKGLDPSLRNGVAFKGISRSVHTVYHFGAGLPGAELDRIRSQSELFSTFPSFVDDPNIVPTPEEADALQRVLGRLDERHLRRRGVAADTVIAHQAQIDEMRGVIHLREPRVLSLPLTEEERDYWGRDVPSQMCTREDRESFECEDGRVKAQIWQQFAYAHKLVAAGVTRTVALEFDYMDLHGYRPESAVRTQARQLARPLARLVRKLQEDGLYDRTAIAIYTADGSRSPRAGSYGNDGKNTLILAGGGIRGGYWGDISLTDDGSRNRFRYHPPDPETGAPSGDFGGIEGRLDSGRVWRTVARAAGIPDALCDTFPEVAGKRALGFALR